MIILLITLCAVSIVVNQCGLTLPLYSKLIQSMTTTAKNLGRNPRAANKLVAQLCKDVSQYFQPLLAASSSPDKIAIEQHIKAKLTRFTADIPDLLEG